MVKTLGQSAMEYMLTYGWAILVVMVVGIVMWQIGIFELSGSIPTTSDGFAQLKPMLATCKMDTGIFSSVQNGFQCMFTNPLGASIRITDINVTINGKYCQFLAASDVPNEDPDPSSAIYVICSNELLCPGSATCNNWNLGDRCGCDVAGTFYCLNVPGESTFFVSSATGAVWKVWYPNEPCWDIKPGKKYEVFVDITYDLLMLGETVTKHSTGHIRGMME